MTSDQQNLSFLSTVNHGEDEPSVSEFTSDPAVRMPIVISDDSTISKDPPQGDVVPVGASLKNITIPSYVVVSREDVQTTGLSHQPVTAASTPFSLSPGRGSDTNITEKNYTPKVIRYPTRTMSSSTAQHSSLVARTTTNILQLLGLGTIFANRTYHTGDAKPFAKPTLDPSSVRWCSPDQWVPDAHVVNCMAPDCKMSFSIFTRKEHCKLCGKVFCSSCCSNEIEILVESSPRSSHSRNVSGNVKGSDSSFGNGTPHPKSHFFVLNEADGTPIAGSPSHSTKTTPVGAMITSSSGAGIGTTATASANLAPAASCAAPVDHVGSVGTSLSQTSKGMTCRVCNECFYETQLVISSRREDGSSRRKCRGQLKMFQRALLVNVLSFLSLRDLLETALVSSEFYFMSRDNVIWYQYNTARWLKETEDPHLSFTGDTNHMLTVAAANSNRSSGTIRHWLSGHDSYHRSIPSTASSTPAIALDGSAAGAGEGPINFPRAPVLEDATALTQGEAFKRVISHHARYNYTQFLDFARRQEMARCEGLAWFSVAARVLFSGTIRIALIGPPGVGKTASLLAFLKKNIQGGTVHPTMGFTRHRVTLGISGESRVGVDLEIYDLSGDERYEALRRFICSHCHAIGLCYNPCHKVTLVQAADVMMGVEPTLGPQPVVVCGLIPSAETNAADVNSARPADESNRFNGTPLGLQASLIPNSQCPGSRPDIALRTLGTTSSEISATSQVPTALSTTLPNGAVSSPLISTDSTCRNVKLNVEGASNLQSQGSTSCKHTLPIEVSEQDAAGITVRDGGSLQCPIYHTHAFYDRLLCSLIDRLSLAIMANRTSIADLTVAAEETEANRYDSLFVSTSLRSYMKRDPKIDKAIAEELLKLTMQPSVLNILLDR